MRQFILASASPRRQSLLREAGYEFVVHPAGIDEEVHPAGLTPIELARFLAEAKANSVADQFPEDMVLAADTIVAFGDKVLGKPADALHAREMLELLAGTTHIVITGLAVACRATNFFRATHVMSAVRMKMLGGQEIERYVQSGDWQGKAGGYGIQDCDPFVIRTAGSHSNIVGLPMRAARELLVAAGIRPTLGVPES